MGGLLPIFVFMPIKKLAFTEQRKLLLFSLNYRKDPANHCNGIGFFNKVQSNLIVCDDRRHISIPCNSPSITIPCNSPCNSPWKTIPSNSPCNSIPISITSKVVLLAWTKW